MRSIRFLLLMCGMGVLCSGCMLARDATRTLVVEPAEYPTHLEHVVLLSQACKMGEKAWKHVNVDGQTKHHDDYRKGFISGFADYIQFGGNGDPPPLPPRCYWAKETPEGRQQALEWFAGFRHGAREAQQSGVRELILVPASASVDHGEPVNTGHPGPNGTVPTTRVPDPPVLPAPKVLESRTPAASPLVLPQK